MKEEFIGRLWENKNNKQLTLQLQKKSLSSESLKLLEDPTVVGFKFQVVETYTQDTMPKETMKCEGTATERQAQTSKRYYIKKRDIILERSRQKYKKNRLSILAKKKKERMEKKND